MARPPVLTSSDVGLTRNAVVDAMLVFTDDGERLPVHQVMQVRNVP